MVYTEQKDDLIIEKPDTDMGFHKPEDLKKQILNAGRCDIANTHDAYETAILQYLCKP